MSPDDQARVRSIASRQWCDAQGEWRPLLSDEEVMNLCISRGTLNSDERALINDHMRVTLNMLESLPFPRTLRRVPEYAGGHHEKMDGSGFPRGLTREQMSLPARMMAIADVFEALTASERPYKPPMKLSQALGILQRMVAQNHIDPELYQVFLEQRVWERYARAHLRAEQLDVSDPVSYR
jgi:HD-GYP domain-containing protein (c-di-GMP phosphodiesterase class II)